MFMYLRAVFIAKHNSNTGMFYITLPLLLLNKCINFIFNMVG